MKKIVPFTVKKEIEYDTPENLKIEAQKFANGINMISNHISPGMVESIGGFIEEDKEFASFLKIQNPGPEDVKKVVGLMMKKYAAKIGGSFMDSINPFSKK